MNEVEVRSEQIRTLYRHGPAVLVTNLLNAGIVCALLWDTQPKGRLGAFAAAIVVMAAGRFGLHRSYWRAAPSGNAALGWGPRFALGAGLAGVIWGLASWFLYVQRDEPSRLILPFVVAGMTAAAAATTSIYLPAFIAFVAPILFGMALRVFSMGDPLHLAMGGMVSVFGAGIAAVAFVNQRALTAAFRLRFQNDALLGELSLARERLEETNRTLEQRVEERTRAFEKQAEALRDAQRLETVGRLAGGIAHDFNNLLTVVLANASELIERRGSDDAWLQKLAEVRAAATRGADLVQQLLVFGRRQGTRPVRLELRQRLSRLAPLLRRLLGESLELELELGEKELYVDADPAQIELLITNLVTNARDAIEGAGRVSITTESLDLDESAEGIEPGAYVLLSVRDTGVGMDPETRRHVFEPFYTTKDFGTGAGLGLAAVHGIVEQSGGKIRLDSEPRQGSCFRVYLPRVALSPEPKGASAKAPATTVRARTVLLVEDDPAVRAVTERMLKRAGYATLGAEHGERALEVARAHAGAIDLLVTDVVMPGLSGPELARRMRALCPGIPTLFISGYAREHHLVESDDVYPVGFLAKPFTREALDAEITSLVARAAVRRNGND
jgi:signal transduction histidine kinase/ActR/RegA family two-component response regulator